MLRRIKDEINVAAYTCLEEARSSIARMGKYAEEMIEITKSYMQVSMEDIARTFELEQMALGYELDLSLTNARRHNEQSCERLTLCINKVRRQTEDTVTELREYLYQCVYA
ncbi:Integral membrane sensor signal transduction histidine kinase [Operophtera brumata]|uniref:Integral membrane sensor signal transduction histidine kinase n=1 Tax=Operophtera brumata TaxID=104452 RepID=A0A0L7KX72_OPEBR|nr:Integral membrane sensor signal transduction histidine kinase [Operophtera brumata]